MRCLIYGNETVIWGDKERPMNMADMAVHIDNFGDLQGTRRIDMSSIPLVGQLGRG